MKKTLSPICSPWMISAEHMSRYLLEVDTMSVAQLKKYLAYIDRTIMNKAPITRAVINLSIRTTKRRLRVYLNKKDRSSSAKRLANKLIFRLLSTLTHKELQFLRNYANYQLYQKERSKQNV